MGAPPVRRKRITSGPRDAGSGSDFFAWRTSVSSPGFDRRVGVGLVGIPDVHRVERLIRKQVVERAA